MLSYKQDESAAEALLVAQELGEQLGGREKVWLDVYMSDKSEAAMKEAVSGSQALVCMLTPGYFESEWCRKELAWAAEFEKTVISCYPAAVNVGAVLQHECAPTWLKSIQSYKIDLSDPDFVHVSIQKILRSSNRNVNADSKASSFVEPGECSFLVNTDKFGGYECLYDGNKGRPLINAAAMPLGWSNDPTPRPLQ